VGSRRGSHSARETTSFPHTTAARTIKGVPPFGRVCLRARNLHCSWGCLAPCDAHSEAASATNRLAIPPPPPAPSTSFTHASLLNTAPACAHCRCRWTRLFAPLAFRSDTTSRAPRLTLQHRMTRSSHGSTLPSHARHPCAPELLASTFGGHPLRANVHPRGPALHARTFDYPLGTIATVTGMGFVVFAMTRNSSAQAWQRDQQHVAIRKFREPNVHAKPGVRPMGCCKGTSIVHGIVHPSGACLVRQRRT